jgi:heterodisulfide reductase subunit C
MNKQTSGGAGHSQGQESGGSRLEQLESLAGTKIANCYECGKCTAGCPAADRMEWKPNQVIRMLQLNQIDKALQSNSIWQCISCLTCASRCPQDVDLAALMDALREMSLKEGKTCPQAQQIVAFQKAFLDNIRHNGRLNELELIARFKSAVLIGSRQISFLFKDALLAPQLMKRKKLHLSPERAADREVLDRIFARCTEGAEK